MRADDVPFDDVVNLGPSVVKAVGEKRSTWQWRNLYAEEAGQTMGWRFANPETGVPPSRAFHPREASYDPLASLL